MPRQQLEASHQKEFFKWLSFQYPKVRELSFAIPNGGQRNVIEARSLKRQGVTAGIPDVFIAVPNEEYHGLFIEFKFGKNKPTAKQSEKIDALEYQDYKVVVCYSWYEARDVVLDYIKSDIWWH